MIGGDKEEEGKSRVLVVRGNRGEDAGDKGMEMIEKFEEGMMMVAGGVWKMLLLLLEETTRRGGVFRVTGGEI